MAGANLPLNRLTMDNTGAALTQSASFNRMERQARYSVRGRTSLKGFPCRRTRYGCCWSMATQL